MTELLAPAGGMPQLEAALRYGADAVYGALKSYGLRAGAGNFTWDELEKALKLCHDLGRRFYLTLNILSYDEDLDGLAETALRARSLGVDGAIVSDLGAVSLLREKAPDLPLHISTQASVTNARAALTYYRMGARRVVVARELSLERIRALRDALPADMEIEAFVHGAMCMAYSGRCLLSDHLTGRGSNQGACAQPCRWQYALMEQKRPGQYMPIEQDDRGTYILSSYDLCMLSHLPDLLSAGVSSLKIEGRMKTAYYVATVTYAYRAALNALQQGEDAYRALLPALKGELNKASHRAYCTGFYYGDPVPAAGAEGFSQDMEFVAQALSYEEGRVRLLVKNRFQVGDTLEALTPRGPVEVPVSAIYAPDGRSLPFVSVAGDIVRVPAVPLSAGDILRGPNRNHRGQA